MSESTTRQLIASAPLIHWERLTTEDIYAIAESADNLADLLVRAGLSPSGRTPVAWLDELHNIACDVLLSRDRTLAAQFHGFLMEPLPSDEDTRPSAGGFYHDHD